METDELRASNKELDDASQHTDTADNRKVFYEREEREYVVKFVFRPKKSESAKVANTHFSILHVMRQVYPEVKIFDNQGRAIKDMERLKNYTDYARHFNLQYFKGNDKKFRSPMYLVFHRLRSRVPISEIRRHHSISARLKRHEARMVLHQWKEDETRISNLGFFVGIDPSNVLESEAIENIKQEIVSKTNRSIKNIPPFRLQFSSPFCYTIQHKRRTTIAYSMQCRQIDAKTMLKLLMQTYKDDPKFLFHRMKHETPESKVSYLSVMYQQNEYLADVRIIPVEGITNDVKFYLESALAQMPDFQGMTQHKNTQSEGRWNIHTINKRFEIFKERLVKEIPTMVSEIMEKNKLEQGKFPKPPGVVTKKNRRYTNDNSEDSSEVGSFDTYLSSCQDIYATTKEENALDDSDDEKSGKHRPPTASQPATQAWVCPTTIKTVNKIPSVVETNISYQTPSQISLLEEKEKRHQAETTRLNQRIVQLEAKLDALTQQQTPEPSATNQPQVNATQGQPPTETTRPTSSAERQVDYERIMGMISTAMATHTNELENRILQRIQEQPHQVQTSNQAPSAASQDGQLATEQMQSAQGPVDMGGPLDQSGIDLNMSGLNDSINRES